MDGWIRCVFVTGSGGKHGSQETPAGVRLGVFAPHVGRSEISPAPVWNLEVTDWLRRLPPPFLSFSVLPFPWLLFLSSPTSR